MSRDKFNDDCPDCRPVIIEPSGKVLPDEHPTMKRMLEAWFSPETTREQREAWHSVCCLNSRDARDVELARALVDRMLPKP